jgi:hypothetical protein
VLVLLIFDVCLFCFYETNNIFDASYSEQEVVSLLGVSVCVFAKRSLV